MTTCLTKSCSFDVTMHVLRGRLSVCESAHFPCDFESGK